MGLFFVLFFWLIVGLILAGVAGGVSMLLGPRKVAEGNGGCLKHLIFPLGCLTWAGGIFLVSMVANAFIFGQDPGIGDGWECRLPGDFELLMLDVNGAGRIRPTKGEFSEDLGSVMLLHLGDKSFFGATDKRSTEEENREGWFNYRVTSYFLLDWHTRNVRWFSTELELRKAAEKLGVRLDLKPVIEIYFERRNYTIDGLALLATIGGPAYWLWRRRQVADSPLTASSD